MGINNATSQFSSMYYCSLVVPSTYLLLDHVQSWFRVFKHGSFSENKKYSPSDEIGRNPFSSIIRIHSHHGDTEEFVRFHFIKNMRVPAPQFSVNGKVGFIGRINGILVFLLNTKCKIFKRFNNEQQILTLSKIERKLSL